MTKIIAVLSEKGGSGKTNTSINLSRYLLSQGKTVALFDNDPQGSANFWRSRNQNNENAPSVFQINYPITKNDIALASSLDFIVIDGSPGLEADSRLNELVIFLKQLTHKEELSEYIKESIHSKLKETLGAGNQVIARNSAAIRLADFIIIPASVSDQDTMIAETMIRSLIDDEKQSKCMVLLNQARQENTKNEKMYRDRFIAQDIKVLETTVLTRQIYDSCYRNGSTVLDDNSDPKATAEIKAVMSEILNIIEGEK